MRVQAAKEMESGGRLGRPGPTLLGGQLCLQQLCLTQTDEAGVMAQEPRPRTL